MNNTILLQALNTGGKAHAVIKNAMYNYRYSGEDYIPNKLRTTKKIKRSCEYSQSLMKSCCPDGVTRQKRIIHGGKNNQITETTSLPITKLDVPAKES